jgi:hypothetical protein
MVIESAIGFLVLFSIVGTYAEIRRLRADVGKQTDVLLMILEAVDDKS